MKNNDLDKNIKCAVCGNPSPYPAEIEIHSRHCYIEGIGQLCIECFKEFIKNNNKIKNII